MKSQLNKIIKVTLVILIFTLFKSYSIADVTEFTEAISEAREKFNNASEASTEQSKIIDEAFKEIDKATEYVQAAINNNNAEDAIKTLEFIEKSLTDVQSIIPQEFGSDMSKIDVSAIPKQDMEIITEVTAQMNVAKEKKQNDFMSDLVDLNLKGIDTISISENLNGLGVDTIKLVLDVEGSEKLETWTKEQWAESYTGSILNSDGTEAITDQEISSKVTELEDKFQQNTLKIENKRIELANLNSELNPINSDLEILNEKKTLLTSQYNIELSKLSAKNLSELETQKSIELSEKLKNQIEDISSDVLQAEQKSNSLNAEILSLQNNINEQILVSNNLRGDINNLNQNRLELTDSIALKAAKLNELKGQTSELSSNTDIAELTNKLNESEKLKTQLTDLQSQIEGKNLAVSEKISQVNSLNSQLDPISNQIKSLQEKREALQNQYNSEISNISNSFNNNELIKSQELAANFNNEINSVSSEIKSIEASSSQIQSDISQLNLEISSEKDSINKIAFEITNSQNDLDRTLDIISSKEIQLDQLKNTDLTQVNQKLNEQLNQVSLQKDFIESQFEGSIDKEVEALQRYYTALGDVDSEYFDEEVEFAIREVGVILDSDPRKAAAFEIEKWATYAGLSKDFIQQGINAVNNDDWDAQKQIYKDITKALAKSPDWQVDVPSDAELNVMIAEEKTLRQAIEILNKGDEIKKQVDSIINEKTKPYQELSSLNKTHLQYAVLMEGTSEKKFFDAKFNELVDESYVQSLQQQISNKQTEMEQIQTETREIGQRMLADAKEIQREAQNFQIKSFDLAQQKNEWLASINEADQTVYGGLALLNRDRGNPDWKELFLKSSDFDDQIAQANASYLEKSTEFIQKAYNNNPMYKYNPKVGQLGGDIYSLKTELNGIERVASQTARSELINAVDDAKENIQKITNEEIAKNPDYNYAEELNKILNEIPTFDSAKQKRVNEVLTGINASWGYQVNVGDKAAALRAALGEQNDYEAYTAAVKAMSEMGKAPVSQYMTGPYWEMSNVKAAAIVRSKKYDWVDDYAYSNAWYEEPLQLNTADRQYVESELKNLLGNNNPKFNALTKQANALKAEIDTNNVELSNINSNISKLENEISSIKSSEQNLKNQIAKLNNDLTSKQSIIDGKNQSLTDLQKNLDPISNKISELEAKKNDLNNNINNQIALISQNTKKSEEITQKTLELETKLNKELTEIDQQISGYKKETEKLTVNISSLNKEILNLESEKPDLSNKISKINDELVDYSNLKAELSVLTAEKKVKVENIDIEVSKLESELSNLKASESQINQQLASLSNELKSKEDIIKNNNLSISEIQKQIDPLNSQIETLENQKVSLNEQFNKDLAELSDQIEKTTETDSAEVDKLKSDFESQISKLNEEINNFESQANDLNSTVTALNEEIKSIEIETPQISNQIAKLYNDSKNFTNIKADLAMATAKRLGLNVNEETLKSIKVVEGKVVVTLKGTGIVRIVDESMLIDEAEKYIDPTISKLSINNKVYSAKALNRELISPEFLEASKSLPVSKKVEVIAETTALNNAGAETEQATKYASAKAARLAARAAWDAAAASGDKVAAQAAEDAFMAAKVVEQEAGLAAAAAVGAASVASAAAQSVTTEVAQAVQEAATEAAQSITTEVAEAAKEASKDVQQAALDALWELEQMPGSSGMHTLEVTAAIRQVQAEMHGHEFNYMGHSSYEAAMAAFAEAEAAGKTQSDLVKEVDGDHDPNRMGPCGKPSC